MANSQTSAAFADSKPHYILLDGLRGVAALTVVFFHIFEAFATSHIDQKINHGYLAVDFFFILSGFVMGYAYDDRWNTMTVNDFMKRRLIRLHPMVVLGAFIGAGLFYLQGCSAWDVSAISIPRLLVATLLNACLIPATPGFEIRGVGEMFPLNGPSWSLLFEYIGNILYAFLLSKLSTKVLSVLVFLAGCGLAAFAIWGPYGDVCVGFSLTKDNILGGSLRLLFSFPAGLLLARVFRPVQVKGVFWMGSLTIVMISALPRIGGSEHLWMNGLYDTVCVTIIFPVLVYLGAAGTIRRKQTARLCKSLGDLSYPLYMVHYPFIYWYYAWVKNEKLSFVESWPGALALVVGSVLLAHGCLKYYDEPIRRWLTKRFLLTARESS
ncbi:acyltransferase family protein [Larkinella sp. VNQ87]|uniref:acyltransferase family protein n=1 Tax=Larkinella sp. VNQ87 TaxID=3400921 RepID=UPI003BFF0F82